MKDEYSANLFELEEPETIENFYKELEESSLKYCYFRADSKLFLLLYGDKYLSRDGILNSIKVIEDIKKKKQRFRSLRGYFSRCLELRNSAGYLQDIKNNLGDSFWEDCLSGVKRKKN